MEQKATVTYYTTVQGENPVKEFIDSLAKTQKSKIFRVFQYMQEFGLQTPLPHVKKLIGTSLWEIRILGQDNIRVLYAAPQKDTILLLHGFVKKKQKTPIRELGTALNRFRDWISRNS